LPESITLAIQIILQDLPLSLIGSASSWGCWRGLKNRIKTILEGAQEIMGRNSVDTIKIISKAVTLLRTYGTGTGRAAGSGHGHYGLLKKKIVMKIS
jgi:hypothetical protein